VAKVEETAASKTSTTVGEWLKRSKAGEEDLELTTGWAPRKKYTKALGRNS